MSYITQPSRKDGFGAQYQTLINTILYCKKNNKAFVYTPIKNMEHNYDNDPEFLNKIEELMNITTYKSIHDINCNSIKTDVGSIIRFFDSNINNLTTELKEVKADFWKNKERDCFKNGMYNIAVHVRRPNQNDNRIDGANTPDEFYLTKIQNIRDTHKNKRLCFHIYSQGDISNFHKYCADDTILKINMNLFDTFKEMVGADALIMSRSSFSYIAGVLSDGDIHYQKFWHPPMKHWH